LAIPRQKKETLIADYADLLSRSKATIMTDYRGLTVADLQRLRARLREAGATFMVVKNTLITRALQEMGLPASVELLTGPTAVCFCHAEVPQVTKALVDFANDTKILQIKGALLEGSLLNAAMVSDLANMPPREVLLAQALGTIQAPGTRVASAITGVMRNIMYALRAYTEKLEQRGTPA
jgi:large subunit ribosomal protein L10